jgi:hypothetical protein
MHSFFDNDIARYKANRNVLDWMVKDTNIVSPHTITGTFAQTSNAGVSSPSAIPSQSLTGTDFWSSHNSADSPSIDSNSRTNGEV